MGMDFNISAEKNMPRGAGGGGSQKSKVKSQKSKVKSQKSKVKSQKKLRAAKLDKEIEPVICSERWLLKISRRDKSLVAHRG
jgi:hypothetical protein